jgi:predicted ATP-grasp superfamily ATP-dependent carboligase
MGVVPPDTHVLVAGCSTRAIAESAARAGFTVTAIDAFADLDQHPSVRALAVSTGFTPRACARASRVVHCDAVAYASSFENHPGAVRALARGRVLWGNAPDVLRAVRSPHLLAEAWSRHHLPAPALSGHGEGPWLLKPIASGGGVLIESWKPGTPVPAGHYLQEFIEGEPGSVAFVASRHGVRVLGISRQLTGLKAFGASGFRYCGSILDGFMAAGSWMLRAGAALARAVTSDFGLTGVNGIDFVARGGVLYPVEVNPRWSASMELVERAHSVSVFAAHAEACTTGALPTFDGMTAPPIGRSIGKAVIFSRHDVTVGDTRPWCIDGHVRDVPQPGTVIRMEDPVCTVFAEGLTPEGCRERLEQRAESIFGDLRVWAGTAR